MSTNGPMFLDGLARSSTLSGFKAHFSSISYRLGLAESLSGAELSILYDAAFYSVLCNIAFNGLGGCGGGIKPGREPNRIRLERRFMALCERFWSCEAAQELAESQKEAIRTIFLSVLVTEDNLANRFKAVASL